MSGRSGGWIGRFAVYIAMYVSCCSVGILINHLPVII